MNKRPLPHAAREEAAGEASPDRTLRARYGDPLVERTIGTIPSVLLRWQASLGLTDAHMVTIAIILSFRSTPPFVPSVSIERMAKWRGVSWESQEATVKELEAMGHLIRPGRDFRNGGSFFHDLAPLIERLTHLAIAEAEIQRHREEQRRLRREALGRVSTEIGTNRELHREQQESVVTEESQERSETQDSNRVLLTGELEGEVQNKATDPDLANKSTKDRYSSPGDDGQEAVGPGI